MVVPFQMVMYPLSKITDMLHLGNPIGIVLVVVALLIIRRASKPPVTGGGEKQA